MRQIVAEFEKDPRATLKRYKLKTPQQIYNYRSRLKLADDKAAKQAQKAASNNGQQETNTKLQIIGLTPMLRELVKQELANAVRDELPRVVADMLRPKEG